ncbi:hypothetical protein BS50DRAFT_555338 [Corynespora cassiicola Philippines]|uniref:Transcription factor domain-containing protein n=1 Tax=Corynespora cassiicola Philippines TaxID=1448308 RepID=A0A2T2NHV9_CORCC|nr:hypothetical protein BS50DRAFT_555338 [Corynespora cassiicola Philippines]
MDQATQQNFTFINLSHPDDLKDKDTIDYIRSSAMTNFGKLRKKRRPRSAKNQIVFEIREASPDQSHAAPIATSGLEDEDASASIPFGIDAEMASRYDSNIFEASTGHALAIREAWSEVALSDELMIATTCSITELYAQMLRAMTLLSQDTKDSLCYIHKAVQMIKTKLDDPEQHTSDGLLGPMCGFLMHDNIIADFDGWNNHMQGLLKIIRLRGGLNTVTNLQLYICLAWADICGSFSQNQRPHLPLPSTWSQSIDPDPDIDQALERPHNSIISAYQKELPGERFWLAIYEALVRMSQSNTPPKAWMEPILHRLLSLRPRHSEATRAAIIGEVCRIGTLLFLAPIWRTFGIHPVRTTTLRNNLMSVIKTHFAEWGELRPLLLWALFSAAKESENEQERGEFVVRLSMVMSKMGLNSWDELLNATREVLWFEDVAVEDHELIKMQLERFLPQGSSHSNGVMDFLDMNGGTLDTGADSDELWSPLSPLSPLIDLGGPQLE